MCWMSEEGRPKLEAGNVRRLSPSAHGEIQRGDKFRSWKAEAKNLVRNRKTEYGSSKTENC